jgi:hypothetical protein
MKRNTAIGYQACISIQQNREILPLDIVHYISNLSGDGNTALKSFSLLNESAILILRLAAFTLFERLQSSNTAVGFATLKKFNRNENTAIGSLSMISAVFAHGNTTSLSHCNTVAVIATLQ